MLEISQCESASGTVVITLAGKMILGPEGDRIGGLVEERLRQGKRRIVFDLSGVTAIDSTGIGHFIASFNKVLAAGGEMRMAGANGHVMQSFRVSLLDKIFRFYSRVEDAV
jgi:anti-sigma B factor antagonist